MKAATYFAKGMKQADIARKLKVTKAAVSQWHTVWEEGGKDALTSKGCPGHKPRLTEQDVCKVRKALIKGPLAFGYETDLWTCPRIGDLIKKETKVSYHPGHVWKILHAMNFTPQNPETRARERDEAEIERWRKEVFPGIQKKGPAYRLVWAFSTSPASPTVRR